LVGFIAPAAAAEPVNTLEKRLFTWKSSGVAIRGYDTVAYFTEGKPVAGSTEQVTNWNGADWLFASAEHKAMFDTDPLRYAPQYGGYCAYGVAQGYLVKIEPEQWSIVDEKLYLNYDADVQTKWKADRSTFIKTADGTFTGLLN
jgi:YHS domain-containing protein